MTFLNIVPKEILCTCDHDEEERSDDIEYQQIRDICFRCRKTRIRWAKKRGKQICV